MENRFEMVAKTFQGLEEVLAEELRGLGAERVTPGRRMVSFEGTLETLYRANLQCRTALRILKPFYKFRAKDADSLYELVKEYDWDTLIAVDGTFAIDTVSNSEEFRHSRFVTYKVKDAIVDWFRDHDPEGRRPGVRLQDADVLINVHISGTEVTLSLDSSGESLHKRGYRVAQTEAPINEVLAAGIILLSGWRGDSDLVDPMCGSGTFLIEAALIAANIYPGIYRRGFAFERWADFDAELLDSLYNDDSQERPFEYKIYGADISPKAVAIAERNIKSAGVGRYITLERRSIAAWEEAPAPEGVVVTNPPYGERLTSPDLDGLYNLIGQKLKRVFHGWTAWIIGYHDDQFAHIGMAPSQKIPLYNGSLECSLREYQIFSGTREEFVAGGGKIGRGQDRPSRGGDGPRGVRRDDKRRRSGEENTPGRRIARAWDSRDRRPADPARRPDRSADRRADERPKPEASENPLAVRRNPGLLRTITGARPKLKPMEGPLMRSRGWKKKGPSSDSSTDKTDKE